MSELPSRWSEVPLGKVAGTQLGRMLSSRRETGDHAKPYLRNRDVQWGQINTLDLPVMDFDQKDAAKFLLRPGDVLICEGGEVGRAAIWNGQLAECYYQKALHRVRPTADLIPQYLVYLLEHYARTRAFERYTSGSTIAHLPQEALRNLPIPLPTVGEQKLIIEAIEEQFSKLEAAEAALESAEIKAGMLARSIILEVVPEAYPGHWKRTTVGNAGDVILGRQRSPKYHHGPKMRPYLRVANVFEDRIDGGDIMVMHFDDDEFAQYLLHQGDIVLNEGQSPHLLGRPAMYRGEPPGVAFTNSLLRFRAGTGVLPEWALLVFRRHLHARRFMREAKVTTNIAHLSATRFKSVEFPVPPLDEQRRIVAQVNDKLSAASRLAAEIISQKKRSALLRSALLSAAFSGDLK